MSKNKWITVAPFNNPNIAPHKELPINLGPGISIAYIPSILKTLDIGSLVDEEFRELVTDSNVCILIEYEASSLSDEQKLAQDQICFCMKVLWLLQNDGFNIKGYAHVAGYGNEYVVRHLAKTFVCFITPHEKYQINYDEDLTQFIQLFNVLSGLKRGTSLTVAFKSLMKAITEGIWEWRYLCLWVSLEALFGSNTEIRYRLAHRMGFFLGESQEEALSIYKFIRKAYDYRSKVVHGSDLKKLADENSLALMADIEELLRKAMVKILSDPSLISTFEGANRESFLDELAFTNNWVDKPTH